MDPRIARTKRSLQAALFALAREHPLDDLTIADIADRAGVNRSSFYQHYADKDSLLADALDTAAEEAGTSLPASGEIADAPPQALIDYLRHIDENADVYRRVFGSHGSALAQARLRERIEVTARDGIVASGTRAFEGMPLDVVAAGITGSALGVIEAWLARDPRPPVDTAVEWLWGVLLGPGDALRG